MAEIDGVNVAELKEFMNTVGLKTDTGNAKQKKIKSKKDSSSSKDKSAGTGIKKVKLKAKKDTNQDNDKKSKQQKVPPKKQPTKTIDFGDNNGDNLSFGKDETGRPARPRSLIKSSSFQKDTFDKTKRGSKTEVSAIRKRMRLEPLPSWYNQEYTEAKRSTPPNLTESSNYQNEASGYMTDESALSEQLYALENGGEEAWMNTILKDGTFGDKLAAWMIKVQESPVHRLNALDRLLGFAKKKKREALSAAETLKDLWMINLLPDRKLVRFAERPFDILPSNQQEKEGVLLLWYYEAELKSRYQEFVSQLQTLSHEPQAGVRSKVLGVIFDLLSNKPEQEQALLSMLCNKLGDPDPKVAAKARFLLTRLNNDHPSMKAIVAKEVNHVLNRSNIGEKTRYNCICYLNQLELNRSDAGTALAKWLIETYFSFFEVVAKGKELESKMLSALLMGINRAHPFAKLDSVFFEKYSTSLFKIIHSTSFNCSVQALLLLCQVLESSQAVSDRFFRALYEKMLAPELMSSSKQAMFLNVVFRSMKIDPSTNRVKAFAKRLLQICVRQHPGFICGSLYLLSEVFKKRPGLRALIDQPEDVDDGDETFVDAKDSDDDDDDDDDNNDDTNDDNNDDNNNSNKPNKPVDISAAPVALARSDNTIYDMKKREPLYANAQQTCLWELNLFTSHYHPSVVSFCNSLLAGKPVVYHGDPLRDFTVMRFLEKFVFKKPKKADSDRGGSLMQPKLRGDKQQKDALNTAAFWNQNPANVPEDERFYLKYFKQKVKNQKDSDVATKKSDDDVAIANEDDESEEDQVDEDDDNAVEDDDDDDDLVLDDEATGQFHDDDDDDDDDEDPFANLDEDDMFSDEDEPEMLDLEKIAREGFGEESSDDEEQTKGGGVFASAEEFSHLLEEAGTVSSGERKQAAWDSKSSNKGSRDKRNASKGGDASSKRRKKGNA